MVNHAWQDWLQYELSGTATWQAAGFGVYDHNNATHDTKTRADTSDDGLPYHTLANMLHDQRALTQAAADHRQALRALSCERDWQILPSHVELALFAMGVHMTKPRGHDIGSRRSAIAAHSPLMF